MGPPNLAPDEDHENIPLLETHVLAEDVSLPPVLTLRPSQLYELLPVHQQPQAIRLLDLEREDTNIDAPLKGTLRVANLRDCPKFAALSYAWGSWSSPRDIITCNNSRIEITSNCHEALRNLRRLFGPITIWVDSICIHQDDDIEKAAQIPLMEEIYTFAQPTYIWLGAGIARERAMGAIILAARSRVVPAGVPWFRGHNPRTVARDKFDNFKRVMKASWLSICVLRIPSEFKLLSLSDFRDLLDNQWLCRAWTFQELILSSDPVIVCGQRFCDWATFYQGIDILYDERPTFKGFGWLSRLWKYRKRLWADTLPFEVVAPWQDLMSFYELISRPISWHGRQQRILPADQTWTIDKYHHEYMRGSLRQSLWLASSIPLSLILLDVCFMLLHPAFLPKSTLLYLAFPVIPLWIFGWSLFVDNQFMHIRSDQQSISLLWSKLKSLDITSRKMGGTVNGISYSYSLGKSSTPADSIATARLGKVLRDHRSTNAKDQSFAVHGILRRLGIEQSTPDYSKSLATVYTELYKAMLSQRPSMINLLAETGDSSLKAPSWTPDWSTISGRAWLPTSFLYEPPWDFLSDHKPQPMISGDRLIVQGVIRPGKIVYCSKPFPTMEMLDELSDQTELDNQLCKVLMSLVEWLSMIARYHPGGISRPRHFRAIINTLLINQMPFIQCRPWKKTTEDRALQLALHCVDEIFKGFESRQVRNRDYNTLLRSLYEESKYMQTFLRLCCAEFGGKRIFFVTDKGSLGTGLAAMRQGDKVANIVGVSVPLILRESGSYWRSTSNGYRVIGPAFMDQLLIWARERNTMRGLSEDATTPSSLENAARWAEQRQCSYDSSVTYDDIVLS